MLGGVIAVPAVALFGNGWTDTVKDLVQRQLGLGSTTAATTLSDAPLFVPGSTVASVTQSVTAQPLLPPVVSLPTVAPAQPAASPTTPAANWPALAISASPPTASISPASPPSLVASAPMVASVPQTVSTVPQNVMPAVTSGGMPDAGKVQATAFAAPCTVAPPSGPRLQEVPAVPAAPPYLSSVYASPPSLVPVPCAINTPVDVPAGAGAMSAGPSELAGPSERFRGMHVRLRQMGATYCLLESWGPQMDLYRFHCKLGIGGSTNLTRSFEATDADPIGAVAKVMEQVEQWQASRPQGTP
jgi:hypothetical protein